MDPVELENINKELHTTYGEYGIAHPNFRVVWAPDQLEYRRGTFRDMYGDIFIREVQATRYVKKYQYIGNRWLLEKVGPNPHYQDELPGPMIDYWPFFTFETAKGEYIEPNLRICHFILYITLFRPHKPKSEQTLFEEEMAKQDSEMLELFQYLDQDLFPEQVAKVVHGEGVSLNSDRRDPRLNDGGKGVKNATRSDNRIDSTVRNFGKEAGTGAGAIRHP